MQGNPSSLAASSDVSLFPEGPAQAHAPVKQRVRGGGRERGRAWLFLKVVFLTATEGENPRSRSSLKAPLAQRGRFKVCCCRWSRVCLYVWFDGPPHHGNRIPPTRDAEGRAPPEPTSSPPL